MFIATSARKRGLGIARKEIEVLAPKPKLNEEFQVEDEEKGTCKSSDKVKCRNVV